MIIFVLKKTKSWDSNGDSFFPSSNVVDIPVFFNKKS